MVERWGMSEKVGFLAVAPQDGQSLLLPGAEPVSEATQELIDAEVRRIVDEEQDATRAAAGATTASGSTRWPRRCSSARRSTRRDAYARRRHRRAHAARRRELSLPDADRPRALAEDLGSRRPDHAGGGARGRAARAPASSSGQPGVISGLRRRARRCSSASTRARLRGARAGGRVARAGRAGGDQRARPRRSSPASAWRSTSSAGCRASPRSPRATSRPSRARARASSTRARPRPACARSRRRPCGRAAA